MADVQWLVRSLQDGTIRTVTARSARAALAKVPAGDYEVKERGKGDWVSYRVR